MVAIKELCAYCDDLLDVAAFSDYCPNGLQVEAGRQVSRIVSGVSVSQALIDAAVAEGADLLLVHHGFFWKGESPCLRGIKGQRIGALIRNGISLLAYHLPLDAHPELGNNAGLARLLGVADAAPVAAGDLLWGGRLDALSGAELAGQISQALGRAPLHIGDSARRINRVAWCTGAAQDAIEQAAALGFDAFVTGEASERTVLQARELKVHFYAAGHHATERCGVRALGDHLADKFGLGHRFIDVSNPV